MVINSVSITKLDRRHVAIRFQYYTLISTVWSIVVGILFAHQRRILIIPFNSPLFIFLHPLRGTRGTSVLHSVIANSIYFNKTKSLRYSGVSSTGEANLKEEKISGSWVENKKVHGVVFELNFTEELRWIGTKLKGRY